MKRRRQDELYLDMLDASGRRVIAARDRHHARKRDRWLRTCRRRARRQRDISIDAMGVSLELRRRARRNYFSNFTLANFTEESC